jgi:hypothetical protein
MPRRDGRWKPKHAYWLVTRRSLPLGQRAHRVGKEDEASAVAATQRKGASHRWPVAQREKSRQHPHHTHFVVRYCIARASQVAVLERCTGLLPAHLHLVVRALAGRRKHARMTSAHSQDMELAGNVADAVAIQRGSSRDKHRPSLRTSCTLSVHTNCTTPPTTTAVR